MASALSAVGRLLIGAGLVLLLFAGYQLWGTGLSESRAQDDLADEFSRRLTQAGSLTTPATTSDPANGTATTVVAGAAPDGNGPAPEAALPREVVDLLFPAPGEPMARIVIPRIGVDKVVVEGVETDDLRTGPGHFPDTPVPGQRGNAAIAGHRTTYGAPFGDLDLLRPGDEIRVTTVLGEALYRVAGTRIVEPEQVEVIGDFGDNRLTLSACHPKFSAAQRIIVWGTLEGEPAPTVPRPGDRVSVDVTPSTVPTTPSPPDAAGTPASQVTTATSTAGRSDGAGEGEGGATGATTDNGLAGDASAWPGAILWGVLTVVAGAAAWAAARRAERRAGGRRPGRRLAVYTLAAPVVLLALFVCFTYVDRLLPAY